MPPLRWKPPATITHGAASERCPARAPSADAYFGRIEPRADIATGSTLAKTLAFRPEIRWTLVLPQTALHDGRPAHIPRAPPEPDGRLRKLAPLLCDRWRLTGSA